MASEHVQKVLDILLSDPDLLRALWIPIDSAIETAIGPLAEGELQSAFSDQDRADLLRAFADVVSTSRGYVH